MKTLILIAIAGSLMTSGASAGQDNPTKSHQVRVGHGKVLNPADLVGLNPQPEPPRVSKLRLPPQGLVGLNPQPEPPSVGIVLRIRR